MVDWEETLIRARQQFAEGNVEESERLYSELANVMPASDRRYAECLERLVFLKKGPVAMSKHCLIAPG
ncbi:MAG: Tetratricopeptide repeat protein [Cyanobacteriota bacterium erpe_2018_sw_39hr_WHONDRS-SW48-000098_B_bin.30]|nr:Tetratricopeptide repeat protein [Cyanobacteriota bacterium erpe_2018_sw_39hr_WHONDRS-SW48-000098_B_bin.30]